MVGSAVAEARAPSPGIRWSTPMTRTPSIAGCAMRRRSTGMRTATCGPSRGSMTSTRRHVTGRPSRARRAVPGTTPTMAISCSSRWRHRCGRSATPHSASGCPADGVQPLADPDPLRGSHSGSRERLDRRLSPIRAARIWPGSYRPLPAHMIFTWLGFPDADHEQLQEWFARMLDRVTGRARYRRARSPRATTCATTFSRLRRTGAGRRRTISWDASSRPRQTGSSAVTRSSVAACSCSWRGSPPPAA